GRVTRIGLPIDAEEAVSAFHDRHGRRRAFPIEEHAQLIQRPLEPPLAIPIGVHVHALAISLGSQAGSSVTATASATGGHASAQRHGISGKAAVRASRTQAASVLAQASATRLSRSPNHGMSRKPVAAAPRIAPPVSTAYASPTVRAAPRSAPRRRATNGKVAPIAVVGTIISPRAIRNSSVVSCHQTPPVVLNAARKSWGSLSNQGAPRRTVTPMIIWSAAATMLGFCARGASQPPISAPSPRPRRNAASITA